MRFFLSQKEGSTLPVFGVCLAGVFAVVGMSLAISFDARTGRDLQEVADSSALAGATAFITSTNPSADENLKIAHDTAQQFATGNAEGVIKTVDVSAVTTDEFGQHTAIIVQLEFRPSNVFNRWSGKSGDSPVWKRAEAVATRAFPLCLLSLAGSGTGMLVDDQGILDAGDCAIWSNSTSGSSIDFSSKSQIKAASICGAGFVKGGVSPTVAPTPVSNCQAIPDPLATWTPPKIGPCDSVGGLSLSAKKGEILKTSPGVYCGGLFLKADDIAFEPGLYVMKDGPLIIDGKDTIVGEGVTILLSGLNAGIEVRGHGKLKLVAPATGELAGMAIAEDRTTKSVLKTGLVEQVVTEVAGHGEIWIEGAVYLPTQIFRITGKGLGEKSSPYLQIVADRIEISKKGELQIRFSREETSVPIVIEPESYARLVQ